MSAYDEFDPAHTRTVIEVARVELATEVRTCA